MKIHKKTGLSISLTLCVLMTIYSQQKKIRKI